MSKKLLVGTDAGLRVLEKENGAWAKSAESLDGKWVQKLEIDASGRLYAGVTGDGVYWARLAIRALVPGFGGRYQRFGRLASSNRNRVCWHRARGGVQEPGRG